MVSNPRFPHRLKVFRERLDEKGNPILDEEANPILDVIFESECGDRSDGKDTAWYGEVVKADFKLSLPKHNTVIHRTDYIEFINGIINEVVKGQVVKSKVNNMGANIWFNQITN